MLIRTALPQLGWALTAILLSSGRAGAAESCGTNLTLMKSGFETGEQPQYADVPPDNTPLTLSVDYPTDGLVTSGPYVQVFGSYTGPANTGMTVNDRVVVSNATKYTIQLIPLELGANVITVTATTQDGATQTVARTVTYNPAAADPVRLTATTAADFAPLRVPFQLSAVPPPGQPSITRVRIDFDGDGNFDSDTASIPTAIARDYAVPGVFLARARITFDDGNGMTAPVEHDSTFRIQMHQIAYTREVLCTVYYGMKHRLQA